MKNRLFTGIALLMLSITSIAVSAAEINRTYDDYDIVQISNQDLEGDAEKAWTLSYDNNESSIVISLHQNKRSKHYVVRADNFEIAYVCCKKGFGASYVKSEYSEVPIELTNRVINETELNRQKILTPTQLSEEKALELIAVYLPDLVNPSYKHLFK